MIKFIYIIILAIIVSCSLDIPVEDEITGLDAIDNADIADETLSSVYLSYPKNKILLSVLTDDLYPNRYISTNKSTYDFYQWQTQEIILFSNSLWTDYYRTVNKANILLIRINEIISEEQINIQKLKYIKAQTLCLKALAYFDLLQLYASTYSETTKNNAGIILKNNLTAEELPRSDIETCFHEIEQILLEAINLFQENSNNTTNTIFRFSLNSAKALLAKIYLSWNKYEKSIVLCNELISSTILTKQDHEKVWTSPFANQETLLAFENNVFNYGSIFDNSSQQYIFFCNTSLTFDNNDYRKDICFIPSEYIQLNNNKIYVNYLGKGQTDLSGRSINPIIALRTAELYFIKAEAQYETFDKEAAKKTINTFLSMRNSQEITSTGELFFRDLLHEKQKEFIGEGLRYFDLKHYKLDLKKINYKTNAYIKTITPEDYRWLLPIPSSEIKNNKNIIQNPFWDTFI
ncbi:RagB/SusD family nutrient uptake outer membrane protein [Tenacibaculum sp. C7A-26P2]|uniref:RagB/SusD family nutrient uptake outer membrane protein n=1 Tax=Tenacibaculum sp. C7A-26P2 TaxID=3447504 RepID=UPI003F84E2CB